MDKRKLIILMIFILTLFAANSAFANPNELYNEIINYYKDIDTFSAELHQENFWSDINFKKASSGMIYYNSDSLFIDYQKPDTQQLFVMKNAVVIYEEKTAQVVWMDKGDFKIKPVNIISMYWDSAEIEVTADSCDYKTIQLVSDTDTIIVKLEKYFIRSIQIKDIDGNSVSYSFKNECINCALPENIFTPQIPDNTNIIDNRTKGE